MFLDMNGIMHIRTPPYQLAFNGAAERAAQTFKKAWKKVLTPGVLTGTTEQKKLVRLLMTYLSTPTFVTERTPAELFLGCEVRTRLLKPTAERRISKHQRQRQLAYDRYPRPHRTFVVGGKVLVCDFCNSRSSWSPGIAVNSGIEPGIV